MVTGVGDGVWSCHRAGAWGKPSLCKGRACVATQNQTFL